MSDKPRKIFRILRKYINRAGIFILSILLLTFVLYHSLGQGSVRAVTTPATKSVEYETATLSGYIFRDEAVITSSCHGAAHYLVADGEKVGVGKELCRVYTTGNTSEYLSARYALERRIATLEESLSLGHAGAMGVSGTKSRLAGAYSSLMSSLRSGDLYSATDSRDELLISLGALGIIVNNDDSLEERLADLRSELAKLEYEPGGEYELLTTDRSGFFFYGADGGENIFLPEALGELTPSGLRLLGEEYRKVGGSDAVGKLVGSYEWYLALTAPDDICVDLNEGSSYEVRFSDSTVLTMTLERVARSEGEGLLVFSCGVMPRGFDYSREQTVSITLNMKVGYRIPDEAMTTLRGNSGVYVLSGSEVIFRRVSVICHGDGYYVVAERDYSTENYREFLDLNDQVILSLSKGEIYEGRVLK